MDSKVLTRLSHSAVNKFQECGVAYRYHYVDRIRPKTTNSFFMFGRAIDMAVMELLKDKKADYLSVYNKYMSFCEINSKAVSAPKCHELVYGVTEFDSDLLNADNIEHLKTYCKELFDTDQWNSTLIYIQDQRSKIGWEALEERQKCFYNYCNWFVMYNKGLLMIDAFRTKFLPKVTKVHNTQEEIELKNDNGDSIIGFIDFIVDLEGIGTVVIDLKTAAKAYDEGSVLTSPQLSLYLHATAEKYNTNKAGYCVLLKQVIKNKTKVCSVCGNDGTGKRHKSCDAEREGKRCNGEWNETIKPETALQLLVDDIPERTREIVLDNYVQINNMIKNGIFHRNFQSCIRGSLKCQFHNLCFKNSMEGLTKIEK